MCQTSSSFKYVLIRCQALLFCESCTAYGTHALFTTVCSCAIAVSTAALHTRYTTYERHAHLRERAARGPQAAVPFMRKPWEHCCVYRMQSVSSEYDL